MKPTWKKYLSNGSVIIVGGGLIFILIRLILAGYKVDWTGFGNYASPNGVVVRGKTLWDWMDLLVIPLVLALGAFFLQRSERAVERKAADDRAKLERQAAEDRAKLERELATDRQQEAALQAYLDRVAELILKGKLGGAEDERVLKVKRVRTLTVMRGLNAVRNGIVLRFLRDVGLVGNLESKLFVNANLFDVDLESVDLRESNLQGVILSYANLEKANLQGADLGSARLAAANLQSAKMEGVQLQGAYLGLARMKYAKLQKANLQGAHLGSARLEGAELESANLKDADLGSARLEGAELQRANLTGANLEGANLQDANCEGAIVSNNQLETAQSLKGAIMPDGTKHD
jgi:uncharacterized protein YjbI with pentapeptide repeats